MTDGHFLPPWSPGLEEMKLNSCYYMISNLIIKVPGGLPGGVLTSLGWCTSGGVCREEPTLTLPGLLLISFKPVSSSSPDPVIPRSAHSG